MAMNITGQTVGGQAKVFNDMDTVQDVMDALGLSGSYTATINGEPADLDESLEDFSFVSFSESVKGGLR